MKWYCISGSWRRTNKAVKADVESTTNKILEENNGIILGGALGVDYIATQWILDKGNPESQLQVFLPIELNEYCEHFFDSLEKYKISRDQADRITDQLLKVKRLAPQAIHDQTPFTQANQESYYARITQQIEACNGLYVYRVNNSAGTGFAIQEAQRLRKSVLDIKEYTIKDLPYQLNPNHLPANKRLSTILTNFFTGSS